MTYHFIFSETNYERQDDAEIGDQNGEPEKMAEKIETGLEMENETKIETKKLETEIDVSTEIAAPLTENWIESQEKPIIMTEKEGQKLDLETEIETEIETEVEIEIETEIETETETEIEKDAEIQGMVLKCENSSVEEREFYCH